MPPAVTSTTSPARSWRPPSAENTADAIVCRLCHAARAHHAAGQFACPRLDDGHAALAQRFNIRLRGRMVPHIHVHRRRNHDRRRCGEIKRGKKIVGDAVSELGQNVGRGGSNNQRVGPLRLGNVVDSVLLRSGRARIPILPQTGDHLVAGECGKRERLHKLLRRGSHHDVHFDGLALQCAHQFGRLIRSDSAGDAYDRSHVSIVVQEQWTADSG